MKSSLLTAPHLPVQITLFLIILAPTLTVPAAPRPNFVFILGEGQGWNSTSVQMDDRRPASKSDYIQTPALEKVAAQGIRFSDFYAPSPRCTPSRAALLTGKSPAQLHMTFIGQGGDAAAGSYSRTASRVIPPRPILELPAEHTTLPELLKRAGYATAHFGKWHVGRVSPAQHGFDENDGPNNNGGPDESDHPNPTQAHNTATLAIAFIKKQAAAGKPFYLQVSHYAGRETADALPATVEEMRSRGLTDARRLGPAASDLEIDHTIATILEALDETGIAANTYFIYTADHGSPGRSTNQPLGNGKGTVWEGGIRVPLLVCGPGIKPKTCSHVRTTGVDLLPTIAQLAGVAEPLPAGLEGGSLVPLFADPAAIVKRPREELVIHFPHYDADSVGPASAILLGNHKLIRDLGTGALRLFDLSTDISEQHDLAKQFPDTAAQLDRRLSEYLESVHAQMPTPNPDFDPDKPAEPSRPKKGRKGKK
jgi:arylsulfatase A-like enzyme